MNPVLTIAIPTYNRANKLKKCIELVMREIDDKPIEVLISDNASTDNTEDVIRELLNIYPQLKYYRNVENLGADRNFINCYDKAQGEYIWLIGDDDMILPGALKSVLDVLKKKPVFLHLNTSSLICEEPLKYSNIRMEENGILEYTDRDKFFKAMGIYVTFLSSLVLKRELVDEIHDKEKYINTYFIQSHIALKTLKKEGLYIINTYNCLAATGNDTVGYDVYYVWGKQYHDLLFSTGVKSGIKEDVLREVHHENLASIIKGFVVHFRQTCQNENEWDKSCMLQSVESYPDMRKMYNKLVNLPIWKMKLYISIMNVFSKIKRLVKQKREYEECMNK